MTFLKVPLPVFVTTAPGDISIVLQLLFPSRKLVMLTNPPLIMRPSLPSAFWLVFAGRPISTAPKLFVPPLITKSGLPLTEALPEFMVVAAAVMVPPLLVRMPNAPNVGLPDPPVGLEPTFKLPLMVRELPTLNETTELEQNPRSPVTFITPPVFTNNAAPPPGLLSTIDALLNPFVFTFNMPRFVNPPKLVATIGKL